MSWPDNPERPLTEETRKETRDNERLPSRTENCPQSREFIPFSFTIPGDFPTSLGVIPRSEIEGQILSKVIMNQRNLKVYDISNETSFMMGKLRCQLDEISSHLSSWWAGASPSFSSSLHPSFFHFHPSFSPSIYPSWMYQWGCSQMRPALNVCSSNPRAGNLGGIKEGKRRKPAEDQHSLLSVSFLSWGQPRPHMPAATISHPSARSLTTAKRPLGNQGPKQTLPLLRCFCLVFCHSSEKNHEYITTLESGEENHKASHTAWWREQIWNRASERGSGCLKSPRAPAWGSVWLQGHAETLIIVDHGIPQ